MVCSIGFSQSAVSTLGGDNNPTYAQKKTTNQTSLMNVTSNQGAVLNTLGGLNNPTYAQQTPTNSNSDRTVDPAALVSSLGANNPVVNQIVHYVYQDPMETQAELLAESNQAGPIPLHLVSTAVESGVRFSMADIIPTAGATESFAVVAGDFFYDPSDGSTGGPGGDCSATSSGNTGDYPNCGCVTVTTLTGADLEVEFLEFRVFGTFDFLNIYDGPDTASPQIYDSNLNTETDTLAGMIASNGSAVFTSTSGALTFEFSATTVVNTCGWEVEVLNSGGGGGGGGSPCSEANTSNA